LLLLAPAVTKNLTHAWVAGAEGGGSAKGHLCHWTKCNTHTKKTSLYLTHAWVAGVGGRRKVTYATGQNAIHTKKTVSTREYIQLEITDFVKCAKNTLSEGRGGLTYVCLAEPFQNSFRPQK